ncbi:MAG: IPT/TIG domain-containing protein [Candidatus Acidiferrales bacterium]
MPPPVGPTPSITLISPSSQPAGSGQFNLVLNGQGLSLSSSVHFGGNVLSPTMAQGCASNSNCETIVVSVPGNDVTTAGAVNVSVSNSTLGSNTFVFTVTPMGQSGSGPQILAILPTVARAGGAGFSMIIIGSNVSQNAVLNFGAVQLTPTSLLTCSAGGICPELVQVPASAITSAGQISVSLTNPGAGGGTSSSATFLALSQTAFPIEESVNNASPSVPANANSTHSAIAVGGALVAFDSTATNLAQGATSGLSQVYLRSNCFTGQPNCVAQTTLVSVTTDGSPSGGGVKGSDEPAISLDGRFVAFESDDTNLLAGLAPGLSPGVEQIYLRDTCNSILGPLPGCAPSTTLISATTPGVPGNGPSVNPTISALGFFVAFQSTATDLGNMAAPAGVSQIYLSRQCPTIPVIGQIPGCSPSLALASFDASGNAGAKNSVNPALDGIGFALSFQSLADNIVAGTPGNGFQQIYTRDTCFLLTFPGISLPCPNATLAISVDSSGNLGTGDSVTPSTGFGALAVAYATRAPNILPANTSNQQIVGTTTCLLQDILLLACQAPSVAIISVDQNGVPGAGDSSNPTTNGQSFGFTSLASLMPNVSGQQVYGANPCIFGAPSCSANVKLVSADATGKAIGGDFAAMEPAGAFVTFSTTGSASSPGTSEVFLAAPFF